MELMKLFDHINLVSDEDFETMQLIGFVNDGIAKINIEIGTVFPEIDDTLPEAMYAQEEYTAIPDKWIRALLVPFAAGRIKENDSSQFEYIDWYRQFDINLERFRTSHKVPAEYLDPNTNTGYEQEDFSENVYNHMRGW